MRALRVLRLKNWLTTRLSDRRGVAAVEFAFILPLLVTLYFGVVETTYALLADRKVASVASTVADLVAQTKTVNQGELDDIFRAASAIMVPFDGSEVSITVSSVVIDKDGNSTIAWSAVGPGSGSAHSTGASYALPAGMIIPNTSLIIAEVSYQYNSFLSYLIDSGIPMSDTFYLRPRASNEVTKI